MRERERECEREREPGEEGVDGEEGDEIEAVDIRDDATRDRNGGCFEGDGAPLLGERAEPLWKRLEDRYEEEEDDSKEEEEEDEGRRGRGSFALRDVSIWFD